MPVTRPKLIRLTLPARRIDVEGCRYTYILKNIWGRTHPWVILLDGRPQRIEAGGAFNKGHYSCLACNLTRRAVAE